MTSLSRREGQVVRLLAEGFTSKAVARELGLSPSTIHTHVESIMAKLGARNRTHAVALAIRAAQL